MFFHHCGVTVLRLPLILTPVPSEFIHREIALQDQDTLVLGIRQWKVTALREGVGSATASSPLLSNVVWFAKTDILGGWNNQLYLLIQWTTSLLGCQMPVKQQHEGHELSLLGTCVKGWGKWCTCYFYSKRSQHGSLSFIFLWLCQWDIASKCNTVGSHETKFLNFPQEFHF